MRRDRNSVANVPARGEAGATLASDGGERERLSGGWQGSVAGRQRPPGAVVALAGARDGYQVPLALAEAGLLDELVTDLFWPNRNRVLSSLLGRLVPDHRLERRSHPGLRETPVDVPTAALVPAMLARLLPARAAAFNRLKDRQLSQRARQRAAANCSALLCYSYYAQAAFAPGPSRPNHRILFQLHPHPVSVRAMLHAELERTPAAAASLRQELELSVGRADFARLCVEPALATGILAASSFTARTLTEQGIPEGSIRVVPYGVDRARFPPRARPPAGDRPLKVLFVGSLVQRKGLADLFAAARQLGTRSLQLALRGRGFVDRALLAANADLPVSVRTNLGHADLVAELHDSDLLVLPSLAEGFGHVILEAMACGVPVVTTPHTGGPDVLRDGLDGFIVPVRSPEAIAARLAWALDHRAALAELGANAARQAEQFTWERFRQGVVAAYADMTSPPVP